LRALAVLLLLGFLPAFVPSAGFGQDSNRAPAGVSQNEPTNGEEALQSYLQLQEQIHAIQLVLERTRQESDATAAKNAELVAERLQAVEQSLVQQRSRDWDAIQGSNRAVLLVAEVFAGVGMVAMLLTALFLWRIVHRLGEISAGLPAFRTVVPPPVVSALGPGDAHLPPGSAAAHSSLRLLGAIDRLEQRLQQLEGSTQTPSDENHSAADAESSAMLANGKPQSGASANLADSPQAERTRLLLAKGQSLFSLEQNEEALAAFDEVLTAEPGHAEALVRKGAVLERLLRFDEAHECYDRAIAADGSLTIAYLYKGGLFNRQERFSEALRCYEQALKARDKA
jgi:tetratricopeptide (TPR) repeat protein